MLTRRWTTLDCGNSLSLVVHRTVVGPSTNNIAGQNQLYKMMERKFFCLHMAADVGRIVCKCQCYVRNTPAYRQSHKIQPIQAAGPHSFSDKNIPGLLPKTTQHKQYILVIKDFYLKLSRPNPYVHNEVYAFRQPLYKELACTAWDTHIPLGQDWHTIIEKMFCYNVHLAGCATSYNSLVSPTNKQPYQKTKL